MSDNHGAGTGATLAGTLGDPGSPAAPVDLSRRSFLTMATTATGALGAAFAAVPFIASWSPSERARALGAPVELDISKIEPGQMVTLTWRKQAIYVVHRTPDMVSSLAGHDGDLKDPTSGSSEQPEYTKNENRARRDDMLVLIGNCTHLGCLPKPRFDMAGRVFNGSPASTNLRIPPYSFSNDSTLVIGLDNAATGVA